MKTIIFGLLLACASMFQTTYAMNTVPQATTFEVIIQATEVMNVTTGAETNLDAKPCCKKSCCKKKSCEKDCCTKECTTDKTCEKDCCKAACCK